METVNITEWFDITDAAHLRAWKHLSDKGVWPEGFVPSGIEFDDYWRMSILARMADAYIQERLTQEDFLEDSLAAD